jgi:hypothetical protein
MSKIYDWVRENKKPLGYAAAGVAVPTLLHLGFDTRAFNGQSIYDMTHSTARFVPYVMTATAFGKALKTVKEKDLGRKLTAGENISNYAKGALAATALWEGWENAGSSIDAVYRMLHNTFGDYAKQSFPGTGLASLGDAALTVGATTAGVAANEGKKYLTKLMKRGEK